MDTCVWVGFQIMMFQAKVRDGSEENGTDANCNACFDGFVIFSIDCYAPVRRRNLYRRGKGRPILSRQVIDRNRNEWNV